MVGGAKNGRIIYIDKAIHIREDTSHQAIQV